MSQSRIIVVGAGVAGLCCALELSERGHAVEVVERGRALGDGCCSWMAGGMLAPWCERAGTDPVVAERGAPSIAWWARHYPGTVHEGTLVVAHARDAAELTRFAARTERFERIGGERIAELEPDLAGRFRQGLFFADEAHVDPRRALAALAEALRRRGVPIRFGTELAPAGIEAGLVVDCRGLAARDALPDLRGVRGEMLVVRSRDVRFSRPVRLLHPRIPLYVVPRGDGVFMVGATMIESDTRSGPTVRSTLELLNAAYALHPAFAEAEILEINADVRPAFPDNIPAVRRVGGTLHPNGLYRHGFLLAPDLARQVADLAAGQLAPLETIDADLRQRRPA
ncbi:MAG: FAD-dependent oxidoreductase [Proteobacteria bacterium]|nr:FAD-dependent oxidoreductase [Pseudomonadota bacterium]